jgi:hypothetical protein
VMTRPLTCSNSSKSRDKGLKKHGLDVHRDGLSEPDATMSWGLKRSPRVDWSSTSYYRGIIDMLLASTASPTSHHHAAVRRDRCSTVCSLSNFQGVWLSGSCAHTWQSSCSSEETTRKHRDHPRSSHPTATQCVWAGISSVALVAVVDNDTPILVDCNVPE